MNDQKAAPLGEATLWRLYRRLLGEDFFAQRLSALRKAKRRHLSGSGVAAALTENLRPGDTLGLAPADLGTRYLCGVPLEHLRAAALNHTGRRKAPGWSLAVDRDHGLLPGSEEQQASFAIGAALSASLHRSGSLTVLLDPQTATAPPQSGQRTQQAPPASWADTVCAAVAFKLPILFITPSAGKMPGRPRRAAPPMPAIPVDRSDTLALYRVIYESAARARAGGGPTWIACCTWPLADPDAGTRAKAQPAAASALAKMEVALRSRQLFDRRQQRHLQRALEREFGRAGWPVPVGG